MWKTLDRNTHDVRRGTVNLLTGAYLVQSAVSKFNQYQVNPACLLCRVSTEDYQHMILKCSTLLKYRKNYLCEIKSILDSECGPDMWNKLTKEEILQHRFDCTVLVNSRVVDLKISAVKYIERTARLLCYSIHCDRAFLLNGLNTCSRKTRDGWHTVPVNMLNYKTWIKIASEYKWIIYVWDLLATILGALT